MLLHVNRAAGARVDAREFTCNIILDYERDKLHSFDSDGSLYTRA